MANLGDINCKDVKHDAERLAERSHFIPCGSEDRRNEYVNVII